MGEKKNLVFLEETRGEWAHGVTKKGKRKETKKINNLREKNPPRGNG